jgi:excinuclease UvrABC nuclease subunit
MNVSNWTAVDALPRRPFDELLRGELPAAPGVYAFYRDGRAVYVGKATKQTLRDRVWKCHRGRGKSMGNSALRRNVAENLGIASSSAIKSGAHQITDEEVERVNAWVGQLEITWITAATPAAATRMEDALKIEARPHLTKQ